MYLSKSDSLDVVVGVVVVDLVLSGLRVGQAGVSSQGWFLVEQFSCLQMKHRRFQRQQLLSTGERFKASMSMVFGS